MSFVPDPKPVKKTQDKKKNYWRSLAEHAQDPEYLEQAHDEFSPHAATSPDDDADAAAATSISRRRFLALASASAALTAAGCDRFSSDRGDIVPYVVQPEGTPPGQPRYYASSLISQPNAPPVLITTREGRPIKLEGNKEHPASLGSLTVYGQSATLTQYDPDRIRAPKKGGAEVSWQAVDEQIRSALSSAAKSGKRILLFTRGVNSPTKRALIADFIAAYPTTKHLALETFHDLEAANGRTAAYGEPVALGIDWGSPDVVVTFEDDFLSPGRNVAHQRKFAERRLPDEDGVTMNRFWVVESGSSITGTNADHRLMVKPSLQGRLLLALLHGVVVENHTGPFAGRQDVESALSGNDAKTVAKAIGVDERVVNALVKDLVAHEGKGAVVAGDSLPAPCHVLVAALNASLGNDGKIVHRSTAVPADVSKISDIASAVAEMAAGRVAVLIDLDSNPAYALPHDIPFGDAMKHVDLVVSASHVLDETGAKAHIVLPAAQDLESWGDCDYHAGVLTLQQPSIKPLFSARQNEDSLLAWMPPSGNRPATYHDYLRARWERTVYRQVDSASDFTGFWNASLYEGFIALPESTPSLPSVRPAAVVAAAGDVGTAKSGFDIVLVPSASVYDGRYANNGWLQELPHPVSSHVWGNGAFISPITAKKLGVQDSDAVQVTVGGRSIKLPAIVVPGIAPEAAVIELGYGRWQGGSVGSGVGVDAGALRTSAGGVSPWVYSGGSLSKTQGAFTVVRTQTHHNMEGRPIVLEGTLEDYQDDPTFPLEETGVDNTPSPGGWKYNTGQKWGMAIDLNLCTGCNGCIVACTAENNVPVVGPEQVGRGREMFWIRLDHYYAGEPDAPNVVHQPMLCQQCDNAPCENVCPVAATTHSPDGLNEMTYNRCVGTRFCGNNCPYKVRRFNWFNFHENLRAPEELVYNPEVTVRSRGVMEKCTFCVQRIRLAQQSAIAEHRDFQDGDAVTACQQACPTGAIVFGDVNDPKSRIAAALKKPRGYHVLTMLGTKPNIMYMAKIRNPHPDLEA